MKSSSNLSIILMLTIIQTLYSCKKDFLYTPPKGQAITEEFINSLSACEQVLRGAYIKLSTPFYNGPNAILYGEVVADNIKPVIGGSYLISAYTWSQNATEAWYSNESMNATWLTGYDVIRQLALVIENIDAFRNEDPSKADDLKGQAIALRALVHFQLLSIFSQPYKFTANASHPGIPYVIESDITVPVSNRSSVAENYANIISDLNIALQLLPISSSSKIVMNRIAAQALLARILLSKGDYLNAKNLAIQVIMAVPMMKNDYPSKLFTNEESEALFQLLPLYYNINASAGTSFPGEYFPEDNPSFLATADIAFLLNENYQDTRSEWVIQNDKGWIINKFPKDIIAGFANPAGSYYLTLLRSSEMYLTASECYAKLNNEDSARFYLNEIRKRAYPSATSLLTSGAPLLDSIAKERRKELCFEGLRMFDLLRMGKGVNRIDISDPSATNLSYPNSKAIAPIPVIDVQVSGLEQNQGY